MHSLVLVLISDPTAKVYDKVLEVIAKHSDYAQGEPYKVYFEPCSWYGRDWNEEDAEAFMKRHQQEYGTKYGRDKKGYYQWLDTNPEAHYDWFTMGGRWEGGFSGLLPEASDETDGIGGKVQGNICRVSEVPLTCPPAAVVTPDGTWHDIGLLPMQKASPKALRRVRSLLKPYGKYYAVAIDAHS